MKHFFYLIGGAITIGALTFAGYTAFSQPSPSDLIKKTSLQTERSKELHTVSPKISTNFSTLLLSGTVQSYETAKISSRADGVVGDISAEVGDKITAGQRLATLLPHGVEGQASAEIAEARAMRDSAKASYENALRIAQSSKNRSKTAFDTTSSTQSATVILLQKSVSTAETSLTSAQNALQRAKETRDARIAEAENTITQAVDQAAIASSAGYETAFSGLVSDRNTIAQGIYSSQLSPTLGALDWSSREAFINSFNTATSKKNEYAKLDTATQRTAVNPLVSTVLKLLSDSETLLRKSVASSDFSQSSIDSQLQSIHTAQKELLDARTTLSEAITNRTVMQRSEDAEVSKMENDLREKEAMLAETKSNLGLSQQNAQKETQMAQSELDSTSTETNAEIAKMRAELASAEATLSAKLTENGHTVITAAISGIVAKRLINVGDQVMAGAPIFEIVDAKTTLSKKVKSAINFGAPEDLFSILSEGDQVEVIASDSIDAHPATITRKSAQIDSQTRTFTLLAELSDNTFLAPNSNVRVRVASEKDPAWQVSSRSVKRENGKNFVWILDEKEPKQIEVELLSQDGEFADIRSTKIKQESLIVIDPPDLFLKTIDGTTTSKTKNRTDTMLKGHTGH